jgi:hypothetical protein
MNSLSLEIWESSSSERFFIFTIAMRSRKPQKTVHFDLKTESLSETCPGNGCEEAQRILYGEGGGFPELGPW